MARSSIGRVCRWRGLDLPPHAGWWAEVPSEHVPVSADADGILAVGGGSAIDTAKHASAEAGLPLVHVPTTYSGAEWTTFYGVRSPDRRMRGGGGGALTVAIVYDVDLTLDLPPGETAGTAMNAIPVRPPDRNGWLNHAVTFAFR